MTAFLEVSGIQRRFGGRLALDHVEFRIETPGLIGLIGPNGAGKTTLFDIICGRQSADAGMVSLFGQDMTGAAPYRLARAGLARSFQECRVLAEETCLDNMMFAAQDKRLLNGLIRLRSPAASRREALELLEMVGLSSHAEHHASDLSFGQRRLLEIASLMMGAPRILLLDEPASGVNPSMLAILSRFLRERAAALGLLLVIVEHNMEFIMAMSDRIIVMHQGRVLADAPQAAIQTDPAVIEAYLG
jgi:ABC-type branched-subunit amino acid transport system ATPase component